MALATNMHELINGKVIEWERLAFKEGWNPNTVFHKSYEIGKPIEVQIGPDKIEILSFPGPVPPVDTQILDHLGITNQFKNHQKHIQPLVVNQLLDYLHPENARHRNQKYLTTSFGKEFLKKNML